MKYEIRIISEEDTVKSRTYEDLDKAIEVADKMFNDFLDIDFGDEIVVVEENSKDKKYLWANGKKIVHQFQIGDKVKIINKGCTYSTYEEFMIANASKKLCCDWNKGVNPKNYVDNNVTYKIEGLGTHQDGVTQIAIIRAIGHYGLCVYMVGTQGLELIL